MPKPNTMVLLAGRSRDEFTSLPKKAEEAFMNYFEKTGRLVSWMED